ncbi:putative Holliday junction resolvase [Bacteroides sp. CAG:714]|nr:putative Holliday junction resolvase [Bacteroides sp. CAG:714]
MEWSSFIPLFFYALFGGNPLAVGVYFKVYIDIGKELICTFVATMSRILAIDYGRKRTGIAVTDPMQIIANGLTTVSTHQLMDFLLNYIKQEPVERIIIGHPKQMNNEDSENMKNIIPFMNRLKKLLPDMPVELVDERFTSVLAHQAMLAGGLKKKDRQNKALVDEISATIILQSYLESKKY